jgi:DNA processing protein
MTAPLNDAMTPAPCPGGATPVARGGAPTRALSDTACHAAALAGLAGMTPVRLAKLLSDRDPQEAWDSVRSGRNAADPHRRFMASSCRTDVAEVGRHYVGSGVRVLLPDRPGYPSMLADDPGAPAVLFALGDPGVLEGRPRVAIVGTRSATHYGRQVASELAQELSSSGVVVVSGLALGIDGAAHAGALRGGHDDAAPPVAVVGTGLDVVYPNSNKALWALVASRGCVFSESPLGTRPHPGVFPARNRIIAALSNVVVVVESHYGGGSLYTAEAAARRSIPVCAVPGSVRSRASDGTNALLVDGCIPVRDATDVLVAISLAGTGQPGQAGRPLVMSPSGHSGSGDPGSDRSVVQTGPVDPIAFARDGHTRPAGRTAEPDRGLSDDQQAVWNAVDDGPTTFETILIRTGLSIGTAAEACGQLVDCDLLVAGGGWWTRR